MNHVMDIVKTIAYEELEMRKAMETHYRKITALKQELLMQLTNSEMCITEIAINRYIKNYKTMSVEDAIYKEFHDAGHRVLPKEFKIKT